MTTILQSRRNPNEKPWISLLEPYLPRHLQRQRFGNVHTTKTQSGKPLPIQDLHIWLTAARKVKESTGDLLTHLAVKEGRQDAVVWLVEAMLEAHSKEFRTTINRFPNVTMNQPLVSLEDMTRSNEATERFVSSKCSLDPAGIELDVLSSERGNSSVHDCLGELWRSLGSMILQAADRKPSSAKSKSIMVCVHCILAQLHHVGAVPHSIYNYEPAKDPSVLQRPPTLHYWSLRIMTVLSDAYWARKNQSRASNNVALENYDPNGSHGARMPNVDMAPLMPDVEPQIWLDFVLWCCVEGGWVTEAAEIVYDMGRRVERRQYSVIDWNSLNSQDAPQLPWTAKFKAAINRSRMREYAGGANFATDDDRVGFLKPPVRTVSSEVIAAIIDGLVNTAGPQPNLFGNSCSVVEKHISVCKIILERKKLGLGSNSWNSVILRMFESLSSHPNVQPIFLESIVSWSPSLLQEPGAINSAYLSTSLAQTYVADPSAAPLGLLHRLLLEFIVAGDFRGAVRVFRRLQDIVDVNRRISLDCFPHVITEDLEQIGEKGLIGDGDQQGAPGLNLQLPTSVLAAFLEMIIDVKCFDLGTWLLHSDDVDGCIIPSTMYSDPALQPSLIRFASAAHDETLYKLVIQQLRAPLSEGALRALLHHQIRSGNWGSVNEVFELLRDGNGLAWDATDVIALAAAILRIEKSPSNVLANGSTGPSPQTLLHALLRGHYSTVRDPSRPPDFSQTRMLNQLARIISSVQGNLGRGLSAFCNTESNQVSTMCTIPTRAFNIFLECVVSLDGPLEGQRLCQKWCLPRVAASACRAVGSVDAGSVVRPDIQTFYCILQPISHANLQTNRLGHGTDDPPSSPYTIDDLDAIQRVVDWGVARCFKLGVRPEDIKQDLPGLMWSPQTSESCQTFEGTNGDEVIGSQAVQAIGHQWSSGKATERL
ncbi:MAG: hypothetical protein LQ352_001658 [Teloschistes flavicans]|nr:MAG: hypothetical protein LQ352_001658 [Teloschistes flavicans]